MGNVQSIYSGNTYLIKPDIKQNSVKIRITFFNKFPPEIYEGFGMDRPDKTMYFLNIALAVAARSTCLRRKFGAVIAKGNTIVGTGYNGTAKGVVNCIEAGCIKDELNLPQERAYDLCPAVHAEENAIINSNRADRIGATLYLAGVNADGNYTKAVPCQRCRRKIINSEIEEVVILDSTGEPIEYHVKDWIDEDTEWYLGELARVRASGDSFARARQNTRPGQGMD